MPQERFDWIDIRAEKGLAQVAERVLLLGLDLGDGSFDRTFAEMEELARNAWLDPVAMISQKLSRPQDLLGQRSPRPRKSWPCEDRGGHQHPHLNNGASEDPRGARREPPR